MFYMTVNKCDLTSIEKYKKVAIVGCGKMGEAALKGWLSAFADATTAFSADSFVIVQPDNSIRDRQVEQYNVNAVESVCQLAKYGHFDMVLLAVKPQTMPSVLEDMGKLFDEGSLSEKTLFVTIAAGIPTSTYEQSLSRYINSPRVVRVMPNMPLQVCMGASVCAGGANATSEDVDVVRALFAALGKCWVIDESQIDIVCAISGGGPAYFCYMVETLASAGEQLGLDPNLASELAFQTLGGTYKAVSESGCTPSEMREAVCSPGGTTLAALSSMQDDGFSETISRAMKAAVVRAEELRCAR